MTLGFKVVTAREMARIEKVAIDNGASAEQFMQAAGAALASKMLEIEERALFSFGAVVFAGKGNNGGDALAAAIHLKERGVPVTAALLYPLRQCSQLLQKQHDRCLAAGVEVIPFSDLMMRSAQKNLVVIDGLTGTGFSGIAEGILSDAITWINTHADLVFSIDIPSGLSGDFAVSNHCCAVQASHTLYLELPKMGFFTPLGYECVGTLHRVCFGLSSEDIDKAKEVAVFLDASAMPPLLPKIKRTRNKYSAGAVAAFAGSASMPGAGALCSMAALRSGAGIVKLFHRDVFCVCQPEIIHEPLSLPLAVDTLPFLTKAKSAIIGPGLGRDDHLIDLVSILFSSITIPFVVDADALWCLAKDQSLFPPKGSVLTPHSGELALLLSTSETPGSLEYVRACQQLSSRYSATLVAKGAPTMIFQGDAPFVIVGYGDPGMATAGSGDALSGIIAALLAQGLSSWSAACLGVYIHGRAGELAAADKSSYSMIASDIVGCIPQIFRWLKSQRVRQK